MNVRRGRPAAVHLASQLPSETAEQKEVRVALTVGFIGLGIMGSRMAANLQARGYKLIVFNRTRDKAEALLRGGATWGKSPAGVAAEADVLFTMLANPEAVEAAA